jgi:uncharacterized protein (TIGR02265 family)
MAGTDDRPGTRIKGASLLARLEYVTEKGGPQLLERVLARLAPADRKVLEGRPLPGSFFPLELNERLDEAIARAVNPLDPLGVYRELGRASAQKNLQKFHAIFLRGQNPHALLEGFPAVRGTYYSDGTASYDRTSDTSGILRVKGASSHSRPDCESTAGYFERAIELVGAQDARVDLARCRGRGDAQCEFRCGWR